MADPTATTPTALRRIQLGQETTPGTAVDATIKFFGKMTMHEVMKLNRPDEESGNMADRLRSTVVGEEVEGTLEADATFNTILYLLNMAIDKKVSGTTNGGTPAAYVWTFAPTLTTGDIPLPFTAEYGDANEEHEAYYCFAKDLEISGAMDEPIKMKSTIVGQNLTVASFTAAVPFPTNIEEILAKKMLLYIAAKDAANKAAVIAGLQSATLIDFAFRVSGFTPAYHGSTALYYDSLSQAKIHIECDMTLEFNAGSKAERAHYQAGTQRLFRLEVLGTKITTTPAWEATTVYTTADWVIPLAAANGYVYECTTAGTSGAAEPTWPVVAAGTVVDGTVTWTCREGYNKLALDFCGVYTDFSTLDERDGADTVHLKIEGELNQETGAYLDDKLYQVVVVNKDSALT